MKVRIEFDVDSNNKDIVWQWLDKMTKDIRISRFLLNWKCEVE